MITTERLTINPATDDEMWEMISYADGELKAAYSEMLNMAMADPEHWIWYIMWMIREKDSGMMVGSLCFKGLSPEGVTEIGYGIEEEYQGRGYATEAISTVVKWAASQPCVNAIEAEALADNAPSLRVLEKVGFVPNGIMGEEGPRFIWIKR